MDLHKWSSAGFLGHSHGVRVHICPLSPASTLRPALVTTVLRLTACWWGSSGSSGQYLAFCQPPRRGSDLTRPWGKEMPAGAMAVSWAQHWPHSVCPLCAVLLPLPLCAVLLLLPLESQYALTPGPFLPESPLQEVHTVLPDELDEPSVGLHFPTPATCLEAKGGGKTIPSPRSRAQACILGRGAPRMKIPIL